MSQGNIGTYSVAVTSDFSLFNQGVLNAVKMLSQQTAAMTNMFSTMTSNASKSMAQMAATINNSSQATAGVTNAFKNMNTNIASSTNQASKVIASSVQQTTASLNGLQSSMNNVNTAGMASATGNLTQQHGNLQNALRASTQSTNLLSGAFSMLRSHLEFMATGALIAGLIGIPALMIKTATETETLTQKLRQNLELADQYHNNTQLLDADLKRLNDTAGKFAVGFGVGLPDVMESMQILSRRFKDVESISYLTSVALTMNKLDFVDLKKASTDLEAVMLQFGLTAQGTKQFLNDFTIAVHTARITGTELMDALQRSGSSFKQFNMGTREAIAAVGALSTETARSGGVIGNSMKSIIANFNMRKAVEALEAYNIKLYDVNENGMKTMRKGANVFEELQNLYSKLDDEGKNKLALAIAGGKYHVNEMQAFLGDTTNNFKKLMSEMNDKSSDAMTQQLLKVGMDTFATNLGQMKAAFQVFAQTIGNQVLPALKHFTVGLTAGVMWMTQHSDQIMNAGKVLYDLGVAYVAVKIASLAYYAVIGLQAIATAALTGTVGLATVGTWAFSAANVAATVSAIATTFATYGLSAGFTALWASMGPVGWAILAITALGVVIYEIYNNWGPILQWMQDTWNTVIGFIADHIGMLMLVFPVLGAAILVVSELWEPTVNFLRELWNGFISLMRAIGRIFIAIFEDMCKAFPLFVAAARIGISNFASAIGDLIRSILPAWGNDVINFFVNLGNKLASITASIGAMIRKNLTITGINSAGGVGNDPYGPQQKEKSPFEVAQEQAKAAYEQLMANNTISSDGGGGYEPTIGNQLPSKGDKGSHQKEETAYSIAKREYQEEVSDQELTAADKIAIYKKYLQEVQKTAKEETNYKVGLGKLELQAKKDDLEIANALMNRSIAEGNLKERAGLDKKVALLGKEADAVKEFYGENSKEFIDAQTKELNAKKQLLEFDRAIETERINRQRQINQAEIDLEDAKNKILLDNRGINEVQYNLLLIENEGKRYQIKLDALQAEWVANKDNQLKREQIETQITAFKAAEEQKRLQMQQTMQKAALKDVKELQDNTTNALSKGFQDIIKSSQTMLGVIKNVVASIGDTILKQFSDRWASTITDRMFGKKDAVKNTKGAIKDVKRIASEVTTQAGITAAAKAGSVSRKAITQEETIAKTTSDATVLTSTSTTEGVTAGLVTAGEAVKTTATEMSKQSAVSSSQAALNSMLAMLPLLLLFGALTGGGGGGSSTTSDGPGINLGRSPDSYYKTPTALSLPSFDVGTLNVPHDMLAQIHKGEVIVPAPFADKARDFISGGGGGDSYHISNPMTVNAIDARGVDSLLKKHGDTIGKVVQSQIRQFKYKK